MSYLVLARRWRPQRFTDLVGQDVVVRTLKNALQGGHLAHAYLLCGIRGVGKTTIARLMAMAVNCESPESGEPCGACAACRGIADGSCLDVQEMDAASHTGVDDVREILDGVRYPPGALKFKVYIIDEAHMLSKSAFNALLKTLEEPPERVLFILATTEAEKLPVTVRSRCQRFDLRRLGQSEIADYLQHVFERESVRADEAAVAAIAAAADGSVRDALSLAERVLAYDKEHLTPEAVHAALGLVGDGFVCTLAGHILAGETGDALRLLRQGMDGGHAPRTILQAMGELWHRLACLLVDRALLPDGVDAGQDAWLQSYADRIDHQTLDLRYQVLLTGLRDLGLMDERMACEMLVMRLSGLHQLAPLRGSVSAAGERTPPVSEAPVAPETDDGETKPGAVPDAGQAAELPLHEQGRTFASWQEAVDAFARVRPGVAAMLDHVVCIEFADRIRLALDKHQQRAIAASDRLAFAEWMGREVLWEARQGEDGETLSEERARQARAEAARLRQHAEDDPHVQALMKEMGAQLVRVTPPGASPDTGEQE